MKIIKPELPPPPLAIQFEGSEILSILQDLSDHYENNGCSRASRDLISYIRGHIERNGRD